jgi:hypothetical protein
MLTKRYKPVEIMTLLRQVEVVVAKGRAERSYTNANWRRLQVLRQQYDPDSLFHERFNIH